MKNIIFFLLLLLPLCGRPQALDADLLLDNVVATMKAESPLQMDYSYSVHGGGDVLLRDKGVMRLDGDCYSLVMDKMGVWCNGDTQWSYMSEMDEIYITDASSGEAQTLSPYFVLENYRSSCSKKAWKENGTHLVELQAPEGNEIEKVVLLVDAASNRLKGMDVFMSSEGTIKVKLDKYQINCNFAKDVYECPLKEFSEAEIIDMR